MKKTNMNWLAVAFLFLLAIPSLSAAQVWYFNDGPSATGYWWSDDSIGPFWEWMGQDAIAPGDTVCTYTDMMSDSYYQPYWASTQVYEEGDPTTHFWAEIYFDNMYLGYQEAVTVTLGKGTPGNPASFVPLTAPVTGTISSSGNISCGFPYTFDFGMVTFALNGEALILKIEEPTDTGGRVHIFWDGECCPSALYANPTVPGEEASWSHLKALYR